jgi:hypothetical protein
MVRVLLGVSAVICVSVVLLSWLIGFGPHRFKPDTSQGLEYTPLFVVIVLSFGAAMIIHFLGGSSKICLIFAILVLLHFGLLWARDCKCDPVIGDRINMVISSTGRWNPLHLKGQDEFQPIQWRSASWLGFALETGRLDPNVIVAEDPTMRPLDVAAALPKPDSVRLLLRAGARVNLDPYGADMIWKVQRKVPDRSTAVVRPPTALCGRQRR